MFDALVVLLHHPTVSVRQRVMHYLSGLRADSRYEVLLSSGLTSSVRVTHASEGSKSELNLSNAVDGLVKQARLETSRPAMLAIYVTLQDWLWNKFVLRGVALDGLAALICSELKEGKLPEPFRGNSHEALELVKTLLQIALLLVAYADQFRQGLAFVAELGRTFHHLLRFPFAGGVFDPTGRAALQRLCLQGLCSVAAHMPSNVCSLPAAAVDAVCGLFGTPVLEELVAQTLNFLARFPALVAGLSKTQIVAVLDVLVGVKGGDKKSTLRYYCLKTAVTWLTCLPAEDRPALYARMLPHLTVDLGGPDTLVLESILDWMSNVVFLELTPDRNGGTAPHERFGFAGRPSSIIVQGNCVMEMVTGIQGWTLVTVRRASGRVSWITRLVEDFAVVAPPVLNQSVTVTDAPLLHSYTTLFRPVVAAAAPLEAPLVPSASGILGAPILSSERIPLAVEGKTSVVFSPESVSSRRGTVTSPVNVTTTTLPRASGADLPPLNPKGLLEKKLPKPELRYFSMESPRDLNSSSGALKEGDGSGTDEEEDGSDLRMAALFSYHDGDDLEEERDAFFAAHSFNGSRAHSTGSSASVSPPTTRREAVVSKVGTSVVAPAAAAVPMMVKKNSEPEVTLRSSTTTTTNHLGPEGKSVSLDDGVIKQQQQRAVKSSSRGRTMSDSKLETPLLLTYPSSSASISSSPSRVHIDTSVVGVPPHASLLFQQMRFIPFCDCNPVKIPNGNVAVSRALSVLDYMPARGSHKIGLLFVAKGQRTEGEIFANQRGSVAYHQFLRSLGDTVRLKVGGGGRKKCFSFFFSRFSIELLWLHWWP